MDKVLAPNFFEYGRSGRVYQREDTLAIPTEEIPAVIPLVNFKARPIDNNVVQITYISIVNYPHSEERALRSSIWLRTPKGWQLIFHQGTPIQE